jgi:hypothetical protein
LSNVATVVSAGQSALSVMTADMPSVSTYEVHSSARSQLNDQNWF